MMDVVGDYVTVTSKSAEVNIRKGKGRDFLLCTLNSFSSEV